MQERNNKGFTLIEVLVYLALLSLILVGLLASALSIFQGNDRSQTKVMVQEEGDYLMGKIDWALTGATTASVVLSPPKLTVTRAGSPTAVVFDLTGTSLEMQRNSGAFTVINNSNVSLLNLSFIDTGNGTKVESVTASLTLGTLTPNGQSYSQSFTRTKYLWK